MEQPKVSVIIPVYRVEDYLEECIDSVLNQTLKEIEVLIIDEGDEDRCREIIDSYAARDSRIIAPHFRHGGYGASVNYGMELAKGEYIGIVESDDCIEPDMYEEMYKTAKRLGADVVKTPYYYFYYSLEDRKECDYKEYMSKITPADRVFSIREHPEQMAIHASLWAAIYKTSYMRENEIRFITAKGGAYVDVGFRIDTLLNTDRIAWLDRCFYNYRTTNQSSTTNNFNLSAMLERWREVHEKAKARQREYDSVWGPYSIRDEYLNTLGWFWSKGFTASEEEIERLSYNLSFVKEETVLNSPALEESQKEDLLLFKKSPSNFLNRVEEYYKKYEEQIRKYEDSLAGHLELSPELVIFSAGAQGAALLMILQKRGYGGKLTFCDNDKKKQGKFKENVPVLSPEEAVKNFPEAVFVVANKYSSQQIYLQLLDMGVTGERIIIYDVEAELKEFLKQQYVTEMGIKE